MNKGKLITFEGCEGCGKSTQAKLLADYLKGLGKKVVLTLEPGATKAGKEIRKILLNMEEPLLQNTELFLFAADRAQHVAEVIKPNLESGAIVICDRFVDSTIAYQLGARKLPEELVRYVTYISSHGIIPDLTFLLDISPVVGLPRALSKLNNPKAGGFSRIKKIDRFEKEKIAFHSDVRNAYLEIAKNNSGRIKIIETEKQDIRTVQDQIKGIIKDFLKI